MTAVRTKPISVRGVAKTFVASTGDSVEALRAISLDVAEGEFAVIVGPSGCGKSTLLNILAGFEQPSRGEVRVGGQPITGPDIDRGMVFQSYALFPWRTVLGNVEFGLEQKGISKAERRSIATRYLQTVGLADFANKQIDELSGGMKQRVAIVRAFATDPSIILMDEPFGALDALTRRLLQHELLRVWQELRKTILFITHSVPEAVYLADRVVVMTAAPGRIKKVISIALAHPRETTSADFRAIEKSIYELLDEELRRTYASEGRQFPATIA
jgi:ABC-type nitrate/sulfonate/bicarbonate transport system ATPase subunit